MIVAFTLPAMAHVKPMMPLLSGLVDRRHEVVCYGHRKFEDTIRASGATFAPYPDIAYDVEAPDFNLVRMAADLIDAAETIHARLLPEVAAMSPRLILQDFMAPWASRIGTALDRTTCPHGRDAGVQFRHAAPDAARGGHRQARR